MTDAQRAWSARACKVIVGQLTLTVDGRTVPLEVDGRGPGLPARRRRTADRRG